jgi:hypothetical protein
LNPKPIQLPALLALLSVRWMVAVTVAESDVQYLQPAGY